MDANIANAQQNNKLRGKITRIPTVDKSLTREGFSADAKAVGDALETRVKKADIVDNLNSDLVNKPLSARMGAELKRRIEELSAKVN